MSYPDVLIVDRSSSRALVCVEAKLQSQDGSAAELQLKAYMQATRCPIGILATPETMAIFVDKLRMTTPDSVALVGRFDMKNVPDRPAPEARPDMAGRGYAFESALQDWIERLGSESYRAVLPAKLRDALEEYVVPALFIGEVRAAGPRWSQREPAAT